MGCRLDWSTLAVQAWLQINTDLLSGLEGHRKAPCVGWPCLRRQASGAGPDFIRTSQTYPSVLGSGILAMISEW